MFSSCLETFLCFTPGNEDRAVIKYERDEKILSYWQPQKERERQTEIQEDFSQ